MRALVWVSAVLLLLAPGCGDDSTNPPPDGGDGGNGHCVPTDEICNGQDDDCDGLTDEELDTDADDDGHNAPGSCHQPADDCDDSSGDVYPGHPEQPYYCDGLDNDCDGQTDEGCDCSPGPPPDEMACSTDEGECTAGKQTCTAEGRWSDCSGTGPQPEVCDGLDNDCDGATDNIGTPPHCERDQGVCTGATREGCEPCDYGPDYQLEEANCDGLDNDCDGNTDEDLAGDSHEVNDWCNEPHDLPELREDAEDTIVSATLYKYVASPQVDEDWFRGAFIEEDHILDCLTTPDGPQCYKAHLNLELPEFANPHSWELCIMDGNASTCSTFGADGTTCSSAGDWHAVTNSYRMIVDMAGTCGEDDDRSIFIVVRGKDSAIVTDCKEYRLSVHMQYWGSVACP